MSAVLADAVLAALQTDVHLSAADLGEVSTLTFANRGLREERGMLLANLQARDRGGWRLTEQRDAAIARAEAAERVVGAAREVCDRMDWTDSLHHDGTSRVAAPHYHAARLRDLLDAYDTVTEDADG